MLPVLVAWQQVLPARLELGMVQPPVPLALLEEARV